MLAVLSKKRANKERTGKWDIRELEIISQRGETWNNRIKSKKIRERNIVLQWLSRAKCKHFKLV